MRKTVFPDVASATRHNYGYSYSGIDLHEKVVDALPGGFLIDGTASFSATAIDGGAVGFATAASADDPAGLLLPYIFDQAANRATYVDVLISHTEAATSDSALCFGFADVVSVAEAGVAFAADGIVGTTHDGVFIYKLEDTLLWRAACVTGGVKTDRAIESLATGGQQWLQIACDNDASIGRAGIRIDATGGAKLSPVRETGTTARSPDVFFEYALDTENWRPFVLVRAGSGGTAETVYIGQVNAWQNRL